MGKNKNRSKQESKRAVGYQAAELVQAGMRVGLGTGSTAFYFIERLAQRCHEGLSIHAVASSQRSFEQAAQAGIPLLDMNICTELDLTIDGADEIDTKKRLIKGGGGALLREKILANMSKELIIIVDETKCVPALGSVPLPVEIVPFAMHATLHHIQQAGYDGNFRHTPEGTLYVTDNGNHIVDIAFNALRNNPEKDHETLLNIPGIVDTGFFFNLVGRVLVGCLDGRVLLFPHYSTLSM